MPLKSYWEEIGFEKGYVKGLVKGLKAAVALGLDLRFGGESEALMPRVEQIGELAMLEQLYDALASRASLDDIRNLVTEAHARR